MTDHTRTPRRRSRRMTPQPIVSFYLNDELVAWILAEAERRGISQSEFVRSVLQDKKDNEQWKS